MKVLFLDIDEVLSSTTSVILLEENILSFDTSNFMDVYNISILNILFNQIKDLKIVISSSWRKTDTLTEITTQLYNHGLSHFAEVIGQTDVLNMFRGFEIKKWCEENDITEYVIIDDGSDMLHEQFDRFVRVDNVTGLTLKDIHKALKILDPDNELAASLDHHFISTKCPFCNHEVNPKKYFNLDRTLYYIIECSYKNCNIKPKTIGYKSIQEAWDAWQPKHYHWI